VGRVAPRLEAGVNRAGGLEIGRPQETTTANTMDAILGEMAAQSYLDQKYGGWDQLLAAPEPAPIVPGQRSLGLAGRAPASRPATAAREGVEGLTKAPMPGFPPMVQPGSALHRILTKAAGDVAPPTFTHALENESIRRIPEGADPQSLTYKTLPFEALPPTSIEAMLQGQYRAGVQNRQEAAEVRRQMSDVESWLKRQLDSGEMTDEEAETYREEALKKLGLSGFSTP
jgi:hypothetical protein